MFRTFVLDLDGTIADNGHRHHLLPKGEGNHTSQWVAFNKACVDDEVIVRVREVIVNLLIHLPYLVRVVVVTGRAERARKETEEWCRKNLNFPYQELCMRQDDDHRKAVDVKRDIFLRLREEYDGFLFFEDDPSVVRMIHEELEEAVFALPSQCSAVQREFSQK